MANTVLKMDSNLINSNAPLSGTALKRTNQPQAVKVTTATACYLEGICQENKCQLDLYR